MPALYVVATPIGNLEDISRRALRILGEVKLIAAEDTRKTRQLLNAYSIKTPVTSYHEHNKWAKLEYLLRCLEEKDVALVSDAGMPGISDPGHELIAAAIERSVPVIPIPGPSVVVTALAVSGLPTERFIYLGFLPRRANDRRRLLQSVAEQPYTIVLFEAPHRLEEALKDMLLVLGDRKLAACRELTKIHEEVFRGTISQALEHLAEPKGEFTLIVEGKIEKEKPHITGDIEQRLKQMRHSGMKAKEAIAAISRETGLAKRELYQAWLRSGI